MPPLRFDLSVDTTNLKKALQKMGILDGKMNLTIVGGSGGTGGSTGGSAPSQSGAAGNLGFLKLLVPIAAGIGVVAAVFEAIGPILSIFLKTFTAILLILLMPFLQLFLPLLKVGLPMLINFAKDIADGVRFLFGAFKLPQAFEKLSQGDFAGFLLEVLEGGIQTLAGLGQWILVKLTEIFSGAFGILVGIGTWIWDMFTGLWQLEFKILIGIGSWLLNTVKNLFKTGLTLLSGFGQWLWTTITTAFASLPTKIMEVIGSIAQKLKDGVNALLQIMFGGLNSIITFLKGIAIPSPFGTIKPFSFLSTFAVPHLDTGGRIEETGIAVVHKGETVVPPGQGQGITYSPTYNISGAIDETGWKRMMEEHDRTFLSNIRQATSFGGRFFNA